MTRVTFESKTSHIVFMLKWSIIIMKICHVRSVLFDYALKKHLIEYANGLLNLYSEARSS
jgi:hypothetical protein